MSTVTATPVGRPNVVSNTLTIARRNLLHIKATPEQLVEMSIQPIMFVVLFVYVFGGAIAGSSAAYLQYAQPPIVIEGATIVAAEAHGFRVRFKTFDYGVISVALSRSLRTVSDALRAVPVPLHRKLFPASVIGGRRRGEDQNTDDPAMTDRG